MEDKLTILGWILCSLGILCLVYYGCCVSYAGFRISMIWIWLFGGIGLLSVAAGIHYGNKQEFWKKIPNVIGWGMSILVIVIILSFLVMELIIISGMEKKSDPGLTHLVVLGCKVNGELPSRALQERIACTRQYLEENPGTKAILSGGQGEGEAITEAECMYRCLVKQGIPGERLIKEEKSTTTLENLKYSQMFLQEDKDSVGIVTNDFHIARSLRLAKKSGYKNVQGIAAPCKTILLPHYMVREAFALAKEMLKKNI